MRWLPLAFLFLALSLFLALALAEGASQPDQAEQNACTRADPEPTPKPGLQANAKAMKKPKATPKSTKKPKATEKATKKPKATPKPTPKPTKQAKKKEDWKIRGNVLLACYSEKATVTVPDGIREIGPEAFRGLTTLKTVVLPDSVETIGKKAFAGCTKLCKVKLGRKSALKTIGSLAFQNCKKLNIDFVSVDMKVAKNAFQGAGTAGEVTPKPTKTPAPTAEAEDPEDSGGDDLVWPSGGGRSGGSLGLRIPHSHNSATPAPDYDQVVLPSPESADAGAPMSRLTLGGEPLALTLQQPGAQESETGFTVSALRWATAPETGEDDGKENEEVPEVDTLVLTTVADRGDKCTWNLNGEVLRRINRSGIDHLALCSGNRMVVLDTRGILAGWGYEALKTRGTASRRFEYEITMEGEDPATWLLRVEGESYSLTGESNAAIYLTGVWLGLTQALSEPWEETEHKGGSNT